MARTRAQIKALVKSHTGWTDRTDKDSTIESLCDSALKYAVMEHSFKDLTTITSSETTITTGATSVDLSSYSPSVFQIVSARILRSSSDYQGYPLPLKARKWWDQFVIDPVNNPQGEPLCALHAGSTLYFDRPVSAGYIVRLRYTSIKTYTSDSTATSSEYLDLFVEYKVTADLFFDLEDMNKFALWNQRAIGNNNDTPGGELLRAIKADTRESAVEHVMGRPSESSRTGITTRDLDWVLGDSHAEYRQWF